MMKRFAMLTATVGLLIACGDSSTGTGGAPPSGGSPGTGGSGGEAMPAECGSAETPAPWRCECVFGSFAETDCAADECDAQAACDIACEDAGGTTSFEVAEYVPGADCDTVCGYVCGCDAITECDIYFWCAILPLQTPEMAADALACQAAAADNWGCDASGNPTYNGPATCN